ncbi:MAG: DUF423 domain-containing protein [Planctomycetota bacterium]
MREYGVGVAAILGFLTVALGAFAAHTLKSRLTPEALDIWEKAVRYQMFHVLALAWAAHASRSGGRLSLVAAWCFLGGIALFSGSLYLLAGTGVRSWGAVTPFGGIAFLIGWVCLAISAFGARAKNR